MIEKKNKDLNDSMNAISTLGEMEDMMRYIRETHGKLLRDSICSAIQKYYCPDWGIMREIIASLNVSVSPHVCHNVEFTESVMAYSRSSFRSWRLKYEVKC